MQELFGKENVSGVYIYIYIYIYIRKYTVCKTFPTYECDDELHEFVTFWCAQ
jgi:hypothetical protein